MSGVVYCHCAGTQLVSREARVAALRRLWESGASVTALPDLCAMVGRRDDALGQTVGEDATVFACYPRSVRWLLEMGGVRSDRVTVVNMREQSGERAGQAASNAQKPAAAAGGADVVLYTGGGMLDPARAAALVASLLESGHSVRVTPNWDQTAAPTSLVLAELAEDARRLAASNVIDISGLDDERVVQLVGDAAAIQQQPGAWFPVIDRQRCDDCMQCLNFCLFDVYRAHEGKLVVEHPDRCKIGCPACSRICPQVAIIFPKHNAAPINGDEVSGTAPEPVKVDISALLGGDVYQVLRDRSAGARTRFSRERSESAALRERQRCLAQLQRDLDVPPEVLAAAMAGQKAREAS